MDAWVERTPTFGVLRELFITPVLHVGVWQNMDHAHHLYRVGTYM